MDASYAHVSGQQKLGVDTFVRVDVGQFVISQHRTRNTVLYIVRSTAQIASRHHPRHPPGKPSCNTRRIFQENTGNFTVGVRNCKTSPTRKSKQARNQEKRNQIISSVPTRSKSSPVQTTPGLRRAESGTSITVENILYCK